MSPKLSKIIALFCRFATAAVFIFSGVVKSIDPWGTAIKVSEYLSAFGLGVLDELSLPISVLLCGGELVLGLVVLFRVRPRESSFMMTLAMSFFTLTTLWIAISNPVADCGCFGNAIKLTNWETFVKNLIILPMSIFLFMRNRKLKIRWSIQRLLALGTIASLSFGFCIYSLCKLPPIDFLPYKVGVDVLNPQMDESQEYADVKTTLIYKDKQSGENREFSLEDVEWQDTTRWEFVDTIIDSSHDSEFADASAVAEFAIFGDELSTVDIIGERNVMLITLWDGERDIRKGCKQWLAEQIQEAQTNGYEVICVSPTSLSTMPELDVEGHKVKCYNMDGKTLKMLIRSRVGVVYLKNGVIERKNNSCGCAV